MAKEGQKKSKPQRKDERSKEEKDAYFSSIEAGTKYLLAQYLGDTSELGKQADSFKQYAESQGLDTEKDLNGLPRHVKLYSEIIPDAQKREKEALIETISQNFDNLVNQLPSDILLQTAVHLGRTEGEKGLEKTLTESPGDITKIKTAFGGLYEPSALIQSYIALNNNPTEIAQSAAWALQRSYKRRAAEFQYENQGSSQFGPAYL